MRPDIEGRDRNAVNRANSEVDQSAADPARAEAAGAATNPATETPPKKKKRHIALWISLASVVIALASAVTAVISLSVANKQLNTANQQKIAAEQQQLATLTTTIVQQLYQAQTSTSSGQIEMSDMLTLEGQSAEVVITELHGTGVTGAEYDDVAEALVKGEGYTSEAIPYYEKAVNAPPYDVGTQASALRGEAVLYYNLGQPDKGHNDFMQAVRVYNGHVMALYVEDNNIAQSYLDDAQDQLSFNGFSPAFSGCGIAYTDMNEAEKFLTQAGPGPNATNPKLLTNDQTVYSKACSHGTSATPAG